MTAEVKIPIEQDVSHYCFETEGEAEQYKDNLRWRAEKCMNLEWDGLNQLKLGKPWVKQTKDVGVRGRGKKLKLALAK